jgi:hypothetical protein
MFLLLVSGSVATAHYWVTACLPQAFTSTGPDGTCLVFAVVLSRDQRALIDNGSTDDIFGQRRVSEHQERLPVQRDGMMLVDGLAAGPAGRGKGTGRSGFAQSQHRKLRRSRRRCA